MNGLLESNVIVGTASVGMYAHCGHHEIGKAVADKLHNQDMASWNGRITIFAKHVQGEKALKYF